MRRFLPGLLGLLIACSDASDKGGPVAVIETGDSGLMDGVDNNFPGDDCVEPDTGPDEECDGVDNDCDGEIDEGVSTMGYLDADQDGYGDPNTLSEGCEGTGRAANGLDCDDTDPDVHPGAEEVCDGLDQDCDGAADEGGC